MNNYINCYFLPLLLILITGGFTVQKNPCSKFKEGKFRYRIENVGGFYLTRTGNTEKVFNLDTGDSQEMTINWINECEYELRYSKFNSNTLKFEEDSSLLIHVEILEINDSSYIQRSTRKWDNESTEIEIFLIE